MGCAAASAAAVAVANESSESISGTVAFVRAVLVESPYVCVWKSGSEALVCTNYYATQTPRQFSRTEHTLQHTSINTNRRTHTHNITKSMEARNVSVLGDNTAVVDALRSVAVPDIMCRRRSRKDHSNMVSCVGHARICVVNASEMRCVW